MEPQFLKKIGSSQKPHLILNILLNISVGMIHLQTIVQQWL
ncbi:unnamed protein product [Schistosoma mattheei]|uniref:Uncharacterized protein n=1 Tax=Schistosoma mattheei TaxID=31246 RepID=A0A183Q4Y4_9TREM|nr:unnamed protein product [Schistosoma mattheei]